MTTPHMVDQGVGGWWVAIIGADTIDPAILKSAGDENALMRWDGALGRFSTEEEALEAVQREFEEMDSPESDIVI